MFNKAFIGILALVAAKAVSAAVINVPGDQPTIQDGVDAAMSGDTVLIAGGTYNLTSPVQVSGKEIILRGAAGASGTILDGGGNTTLLIVQNVGGAGLAVDSLGFSNGQASETFHGGCAVFQNSTGSVVDSRFEGCETDSSDASNSGGAIKVSGGSNVSIQSSVFLNNRSYSQGGAVHFFEATGEVLDCTFDGNVASGISESGGGGVKATFSAGAPVLIQGNVFQNNRASFAGGAISAFGSDVSIINNQIVGNGDTRFGAGIHLETLVDSGGDRSFEIIGNQIENNSAANVPIPGINPSFDKVSGGGIHLNFGVGGNTTASTVVIRDNVIRGNSAIDSRCVDGASSSGCGYGGGLVFFNALQTEQVFENNTVESNSADVYAAAGFDKVRLRMEQNLIKANEAHFTHPGVGCVSNSASNSTTCAISRNRFIDNRFAPGATPSTALNNSGALNVRRNAVDLTNNTFWNNQGRFAAVFVRHEDVSGQFSRIAFNSFVENDQESTGFASLYVRGSGEILNNVFVADVRGVRVDDFSGGSGNVIEGNNVTEMSAAVARVEGTNYDTVAELNGLALASSNTALAPGFQDRAAGRFCLTPGSDLIDRVSCVAYVSEDLVGTSRPVGPQCDTGAFEWFPDSRIFVDRFEAVVPGPEC
jgi:hypothetical protein